jgi:transposase, IS5 family
VSIATPATKRKGGQFVLGRQSAARQPLRRPHSPGDFTGLERQALVTTRRIHDDKGYRGHNHKEFHLWISGEVRRLTRPIRREMKRRPWPIRSLAISTPSTASIICNRDRDLINSVLAAAGVQGRNLPQTRMNCPSGLGFDDFFQRLAP